ncbi:MAG: quinolinate synthase NadA [Gemmatimonadetes bacterium]|nr:quinolinate synthase NadA [Gemmatimonadota bacterium]
MYEALRERLHDVVPDFELAHKAEVAFAVNRLKAERGAVILGHNYMEPALYHSVCDYTGDSLELSRIAARAEGDPIVFCGVRFMAETAKILNPERTVLLPSAKGGCSLAGAVTAADVRRLKARYPGAPVVSYVNTYAEVKAESDICVTSGNAVKVVESLDADTIIFLPDEYLARNVARETGRRIVLPVVNEPAPERAAAAAADGVELAVVAWRGKCEVHDQFTVADIAAVRAQFPDVFVLAHPECPPDVVEAADFAGSTSAMIREVRQSDKPRYLLLTECSMADNIIAEAPGKEMVRLCSVRCPHMNEITLEEVLASLRENRYVIDVEPEVARRARRAIERMLEVG